MKKYKLCTAQFLSAYSNSHSVMQIDIKWWNVEYLSGAILDIPWRVPSV